MNETTEHIQVNSYDPTRTTMLRNAFVRALRRRFNALTQLIRQAVEVEDVFGLRQETAGMPAVMRAPGPGQGAFAFPRSSDKIEAFERWLQTQTHRSILEVIELEQVGIGVEGAWTNRYIYDSYRRGVIRARYELQKAGFGVPSIEQTGGIDISFATPFHLDRVGLLYTRTFSELKGITAQMDQQISRILARGIADGDGPRLLARKLVGTINGKGMGELGLTDELGRFIPARRRAEIMARTEIIRSHAQAELQEFGNWAIEGVRLKAEMMTAGDNRVCPQCSALEGEIYTIEEAQNIIPVHPSCRCCWLPAKKE